MVLFDGLDEVSQENDQRKLAINELTGFTRRYHKCKHLITCRTATTDYIFDQFTYVEIADFDDKQIRSFVSKWFKDNEAKHIRFIEEFYKEKNANLRELAQTPLLLALLCLAFDETLEFPPRRVELYEEALDALLKKWDASRNIKRDEIYRKLSLGRKRQMFARIAAEAFEKGEYFWQQEDLVKQITDYLQKVPPVDLNEDIDGEAVLKAIEAQHGIFVERAFRIYSFSHLTFQEYFTAQYINDNAVDGAIDRLVKFHATDNRWHEVFLLTVSLIDNADYFFLLFSKAISDSINNDTELDEIMKWVYQKTWHVYQENNYHIRAGTLLLALSLDRKGNRDLDRIRNGVRDLVTNLIRNSIHLSNPAFQLDLQLTLALLFTKTLIWRFQSFKLEKNRSVVRDRDYDLSLSLAYDIELALRLACYVAEGYDFQSNLELDLDWVRDLASELDVVSDFKIVPLHNELGLALGRQANYLRHCIDLAMDLSREIPNLHQVLQELAIPTKNVQKTDWDDIAKRIIGITSEYRNINWDWKLTDYHFEQLKEYVEANHLLLECLEVAYVSDRPKVENSLLLP